MTRSALLTLLSEHRVVVCAGAGGVGKTTVAAALALAAAKEGKRVLCLTIDPAKRLADSLGLGRMTKEEQQVDAALFASAGIELKGSLTVLMLDTKQTFDDLVVRNASSPESRDRILNNRVYRYVSTSLAGTQSYMAMEKVLAVKRDSRYDLIVLDTPPTSHALDFLDAPERLIEAIDSSAMRWLVEAFEKSGHLSLNLVARGVALVLRAIGRLTGRGFLEHMAEFVSGFNELFGGFRQRAAEVAAAFRGPEFAYVLVATPLASAINEALFFARRLQESGMRADAVVVNRVHTANGNVPTREQVESALTARGIALGPQAAERLMAANQDERELAGLDAAELNALDLSLKQTFAGRSEKVTRVDVPIMDVDVHDLPSLSLVSRALCGV
jgi:anion-transporting  ArsA/GET3 family ATPase